jgi:S-DNA-T family DNA segregation ATPase FtsK/SpoIIIE
MRGLIYNEKGRDVVLNAFYQLLMKRKQTVNEAGKEKPQFSPHYISRFKMIPILPVMD